MDFLLRYQVSSTIWASCVVLRARNVNKLDHSPLTYSPLTRPCKLIKPVNNRLSAEHSPLANSARSGHNRALEESYLVSWWHRKDLERYVDHDSFGDDIGRDA